MTSFVHRFRLFACLAALATLFAAPALRAQDGPDASATSATPAQVPAPATRAAQIHALIAGNLDPAIDAKDLFATSLTGAEMLRLRAVARLVKEPELFARASQDLAALEGLSPAQAQLALAEAAFLRLPQRKREALLASHAKVHETYRKAHAATASQDSRIAALGEELDALHAFLAGKPVRADALGINLLDSYDAGGEAALLGDGEIKDSPAPADDAPPRERIAWLNAQIALAQRAIFALPPERLVKLASASGLDSGSSDEIARAQEQLKNARQQMSQAQADADNASSERERLIASERARLLKTDQAQAQFRAKLARIANEPDAISDNALSWRRRAQEAGTAGSASADAFYGELVLELTSIRRQLQAALDASEGPQDTVLVPAPLDRALSDDAPEVRALQSHFATLQRNAAILREAYALRLWQRRSALREAMNMLNGARLELLPELSGAQRARVTGFGSEGVAQVRREISEIGLELQFNLKAWRRLAANLGARVISPSPAFVMAIMRLVLLGLLFSWWRKRGDALLARAQADAAARRPRTMLRSLQTTALGHWRQIRPPLDWLILAIGLYWFWPSELAAIGLRFVWIVVFWSLATLVTVRLVNELARGKDRDDPRAALRWKSLRLIAGSLLAIGLMLDLTRASVGEGAIYNWVVTLAWLLVPLNAGLLAHWWRARIVSLAAADAGENALKRWIAGDPGGFIGLVGRMAVGVLLLVRGVHSVIARRIRDMALVREMLEQRARIAAERQVAEDKASGRYHRLPPETLAVFEPHRPPSRLRLGGERPGQLALPAITPGSLSLIVGERGLGKSSYLHDVARKAAASAGDAPIVQLEVPPCPPADWVESLPGAIEEAVAGRDGPVFVTIDDIQRLIVPAIGGLSQLDRMIALARAGSARNQCWIFAIAQASWHFVQRARSERILFDTIVHLPSWTSLELRGLIERRTHQAAIDPDFSAMIDEGVFEFGEDVSVAERKKRGYFERLAEHVGGNPAIALDYWRRSLFVDSRTGKVTVRTFDTPPVESLAALPLAAQFVLRVLLQMDFADMAAIHASTDLGSMEISDALRRLERMGAITREGARYQIALNWWTTVVRLLARQNLILWGTR